VSLPFLTADRTAESSAPPAADAEQSFDPESWRRPYRVGPWRVGGAAVLLLVTSYVLMSALVIALAGSVSSALVCAGCGAVLIVLALRLLRMGVWVSARGLRLVGFFVTSTLAWRQVAAVRTAQGPVKVLGLPRAVQGQALEVLTVGGGSARRLLTDHNADFLGRPGSFERAADVLEAWAAESRGGRSGR
jgi:hypothetical protein